MSYDNVRDVVVFWERAIKKTLYDYHVRGVLYSDNRVAIDFLITSSIRELNNALGLLSAGFRVKKYMGVSI